MSDRHEDWPDDAELAALLERVRPIGPPDRLRARVVGRAPEPRAWPWALAAVALLALGVGLPAWSARVVSSAMPPTAAPEGAVQILADLLGGDARARQTASLILMAEQMRAEREAAHLNAHATTVQP